MFSLAAEKEVFKTSLLTLCPFLSNHILIPIFLMEHLNEMFVLTKKYCKYINKINYHLKNTTHSLGCYGAALTAESHKLDIQYNIKEIKTWVACGSKPVIQYL